jgi:hypothetical protein
MNGCKNILFASTLSPEDRQDAYPTFSPLRLCVFAVKTLLCENRLFPLRIKAGVKNILFASTLSPEDRQDVYPTFSLPYYVLPPHASETLALHSLSM